MVDDQSAPPDGVVPSVSPADIASAMDEALNRVEAPVRPWVPAPQDPDPIRVVKPKQSFLTHFERFVDATKSQVTLAPIDQLRHSLPPDRILGWIVTLVITGIAFVIRFVKLGYPARIMFDETYYAKDAWSLLQMGYEGVWKADTDEERAAVNAAFAEGDYAALTTDGSWTVHPPLGKWLIAGGEWLFGANAFGWRFAALIFGTLTVFVVIRLARRLSHSTLIGGLAGLLLTVDGLHFVMSRIALLDIFQCFFILAAVSCVVADRDYFRNQLADRLATRHDNSFGGGPGPFIFRPWLLGAGVMFGAGCAVKWNTIYPLAVFGLLVVAWSVSARRLAGAGRTTWKGLYIDGIPAFISMVIVAIGVYLTTWIPWLRTTQAYARDWGLNNPDAWSTRTLGEALASLWRWHDITYGFHTGEGMAGADHPYRSNPLGWPLLARTIGIYADNGIQPGIDGCKAAEGETCMRIITGLGTPLLWWLAAAAMIAALIWWIAGMDWRFGVVVVGTFSTWIPWMFAGTRPMFVFYAVTMIPFMCIGLAMAFGVLLGPARPGIRRETGAVTVGTLVALIILNFAFFYPILTAEMLIRSHWQWRMWLPGWV